MTAPTVFHGAVEQVGFGKPVLEPAVSLAMHAFYGRFDLL